MKNIYPNGCEIVSDSGFDCIFLMIKSVEHCFVYSLDMFGRNVPLNTLATFEFCGVWVWVCADARHHTGTCQDFFLQIALVVP